MVSVCVSVSVVVVVVVVVNGVGGVGGVRGPAGRTVPINKSVCVPVPV